MNFLRRLQTPIKKDEISALVLLIAIATYWPPLVFFAVFIPIIELLRGSIKTYFIKLAIVTFITTFFITIWTFVISNNLSDTLGIAGRNPVLQTQFLIHEPLQFLVVVIRSLNNQFVLWSEGAIGILGWMTLYLPVVFYFFWLMLSTYLLYKSTSIDRHSSPSTAIGLAAVIGSFISICVSMYIYFSPLRSNVVLGVQGRYLIPLVIAVAFSLSLSSAQVQGKPQSLSRFQNSLVFALPVLSCYVTVCSLLYRYWIN